MRLNTLFIAALAALTITSCAKEQKIDTTVERAAKFKIKLTTALGPKAAAAVPTLTEEQQIDDFVVFIFKGNGTLDAARSWDGIESTLDMEGTTAAKWVYVLANTGEIGEGLLETITSESELLETYGDLMIENDTPTQTGKALWMSGKGLVGNFSDDPIPTASAEVKIFFVAAKIKVTVIDKRDNKDGPSGPGEDLLNAHADISIKDENIVLLFAGRQGKFFEHTTRTPGGIEGIQSNFYTGDNSYHDPFTDGTTFSTALSKEYAENDVYFYTFSNNGAKKPTIIAIQSTLIVDGVSSTIYYPAHFSALDLGPTVFSGVEYDVKFILTGDVSQGGGAGVTDPEIEIREGSTEVTVTVQPWYPIELEKIF